MGLKTKSAMKTLCAEDVRRQRAALVNANPAAEEHSTLTGQLECFQDQIQCGFRIATGHTAEPDRDRGRSSLQEVQQIGWRLPPRRGIKKPIAGRMHAV